MSNKHFKLRKDLSIDWFELTLFRIEATKDIERFGVKAGEFGGFIEKEKNLSGNAWVSGNALVSGNAWVYGDKLQSVIDCRNKPTKNITSQFCRIAYKSAANAIHKRNGGTFLIVKLLRWAARMV